MLPIRKVVLYKHGVGYFEREGEVEGDASIDLQFRSGEMNDVLKSLTALDLSGGLISSISYESTKPVVKQLEDIAIQLPDENALTGLLSQVKGAKVRITVGSDEIVGIVTGIESVNKQVGEAIITTHLITILVNGESLRTFDVLEIKTLTFLDETLKTDLTHLLEILISAKKKDAKKLTIYTRGEGKRTILASYVVETPVWKVSYRALLGGEKPLIQGWALVDNTQDEDWKDVSLTLVAGLPISFIHDLYSPRYKHRPVVEVEEEEAYAPPILEEGAYLGAEAEAPCEMAAEDRELARPAMPPAFKARPAMAPMGAAAPPLPAVSRAQARAISTPVQTRTVEVGDLFQYVIKNPVTVKRNQSALVPILQADFDGKRVAVYNPEVRDKNPMSALLIKNTTGLTLEGGPLTVMENEVYVGESMLDTLKQDEERLVPYSVELGCFITSDRSGENLPIHRVRIGGGYMYLDYYTLNKCIYTIKNKLDHEIVLFLEHRFNHGWELVDTQKPYETTENFYRFRLEIPSKQNTKFAVKEKLQQYQSYSLRYLNMDQIVYWARCGYIDDKTKEKFDGLLKLSGQIADLNRQIGESETEVKEIHSDQQRLRENLKALGTSSDEKKLRERYVSELAKEEDQLRQLHQRIKDLKTKKNEMEKRLEKEINAIEISRDV